MLWENGDEKLQNPFNVLTDYSVKKPKSALLICLLLVFLLMPNAMFINFDNSEDAFFPDNETVRLLNDVEDEYQAEVDFIRIIDRIEEGDLKKSDTWEKLATIEATLIDNENLKEYQYPLFGVQSHNGLASSAMQWSMYQDPVNAEKWMVNLSQAIAETSVADNETINDSLNNLSQAINDIPSLITINGSTLKNWDTGNPTEWLPRLDDGLNISSNITQLTGDLTLLLQGMNAGFVAAHVDQAMGKMWMLQQMQSTDFRSSMLSNIPADDSSDPWNSNGPILTTIVIATDIESHNLSSTDEVQIRVSEWSDSLGNEIRNVTGDTEITSFSFAQLSTGQNANIGKELAILNSLCLMLLGFILWTKFRSKRDTGFVLILTVFAILATYGVAGFLTLIGVNMVFNPAMNSIPILLLAIGVDYGLHVVARIREDMQEQEKNHPQQRLNLRDFSQEAKREAIRKGTILTSAALGIAIITDIIGFLSFRFSTQQFLVSFGTVIAIGLFFIYLLSITALPALMMAFPMKKLPLGKSGTIHESRFSKWIGELTNKPVKVAIVALLLSGPMLIGFQQLEVGFDTRDNFDESVPVVSDFLLISDTFQSSPSPLYVVIDGEVISQEGRTIYDEVIGLLTQTEGVSGLPSGIWDTLENSRTRNMALNVTMQTLENDTHWENLKSYLLSEEGRNLSSGTLNGEASQTVISFQASTLDWQATADFEAALSAELDKISEAHEGDFEVKLSGRSLILAQVTADVAESAILSTATVAGVILIMLVGINTVRQKDLQQGALRGIVTWIPLMVVVIWVYGIMGLTGYQLNSQTVTIGALTLGLGVDYAVHITTRMEEEAIHSPHDGREKWVSKSVATTGRAMIGAALTTAGGFAVLNFSALVPLRLFGQVFVVAIVLALLSSLMLLPALYATFLERDAQKSRTHAAENE